MYVQLQRLLKICCVHPVTRHAACDCVHDMLAGGAVLLPAPCDVYYGRPRNRPASHQQISVRDCPLAARSGLSGANVMQQWPRATRSDSAAKRSTACGEPAWEDQALGLVCNSCWPGSRPRQQVRPCCPCAPWHAHLRSAGCSGACCTWVCCSADELVPSIFACTLTALQRQPRQPSSCKA